MKHCVLAVLILVLPGSCIAQTISGLCMVSTSQRIDGPSTAQVTLSESNCEKETGGCMEMSNSHLDWSRWQGISPQVLGGEGAKLAAHMTGDAGDLVCDGLVHDGVLSGRFQFTASEAYPKLMDALGFDGITPRKQLSFLMLDITPAWATQMKTLGITDLTTSKLTGLRALHVDAEYVRAMGAAGYPELRAGKLIEMKAIGVTPEKAREARAMGFQPTEQELIQMSIFKIDRSFVDRMRARGLQNLTLASLIKIKIFKLDN